MSKSLGQGIVALITEALNEKAEGRKVSQGIASDLATKLVAEALGSIAVHSSLPLEDILKLTVKSYQARQTWLQGLH